MIRRALRFVPVLAVMALSIATPVRADSYRVDVIVFLDLHAGSEPGTAPQPPVENAAIPLEDSAALQAARIRVLPDAEFGLQEQWSRLRNSRRFQPLLRLAWEQDRPPAESGPRLAIRHGEPLAVTDPLTYSSFLVPPVDGSVSLLMGRFLHLDVDLGYTESRGQGTGEGGGVSRFALNERRRMRRDELHYIDSPKLGVLARVQSIP